MDFSIPGYTIVRQIGHGGSAIVYLAVQENLNRRVALKILHGSFTNDPLFDERFKREGRIIAQLNHPNIIPVYDIGQFDGHYYMTMEYLPGGDLRARANSITLAQSLKYLANICDALHYAHSKGYVHRDIKAENILFREEEAILTDFGIARATESLTNMTVTGAVLGTPAYMSPEQVEGKAVDGRSDLYSIGVVLFQMLCGHLPYRGESIMSVGLKHITAPVPALPANTRQFQTLINRLLAKDAAARPENAEQLAIELNRLLAKPPIAPGTLIKDLWSEQPPAATDIGSAPPQTQGSSKRLAVGGIITLVAIALFGTWMGLNSPPPTSSNAASQAPQALDPEPAKSAWADTLQQAHSLFNKGQLLKPGNANALTLYQRVLTAEPDNAAANVGLLQVQKALSARIENVINKNQFELATSSLQEFALLWPQQTEILAQLKHKLTQAQEQRLAQDTRNTVSGLLQQASQAVASKRWTQPTDNSALLYYRQILKLDENNALAKAGIDAIVVQLMNRARTAVNQELYSQAEKSLNEARQINADYPGIAELELSLTTSKKASKARQAREQTLAKQSKNQQRLQQEIKQLGEQLSQWLNKPLSYQQALRESEILAQSIQDLLHKTPDNEQLLALQARRNRHLDELKMAQTPQQPEAAEAERFRFGNF